MSALERFADLIPRLAVRDLPAARCPIMHIFDLTRILRRGCRHEAGHGESVFVSVGINPHSEVGGPFGGTLVAKSIMLAWNG